MGPDDWVETGGKMMYDSRVTDQKAAIEYYGKDDKHRDVGHKYTSKDGKSIELGDHGFSKVMEILTTLQI